MPLSILTFMLLVISSVVTDASTLPSRSSTTPIYARIPPSLTTNLDKSWPQPPPAFIFGNWKVVQSSSLIYQTFWNFEEDYSPLSIEPPLQLGDVASFMADNTTTVISTLYAKDTASKTDSSSYNYVVNNFPFINNTFEFVAYGVDTAGQQYVFVYETEVAGEGIPPCLDVFSRVPAGLTTDTLTAVIAAIVALGNVALSELTSSLLTIPHDNRRLGQPPVVCSATCKSNPGL